MLRLAETSELLDIPAVLIENLHTAIPQVRNVNTAIPIDVHRVDGVELAITLARRSPLHEKLPILVELHHARVRIAIADKECSIGQPRDVGRPAKVFSSVPATPASPSVMTSLLPSCVNLKICCRMSSMTQTCRSGSSGLIFTL